MKVLDIVHIVAGFLVLLGTILTLSTGNLWFLALPAFVGANLFQFGFTKFCPLELILKKVGVKS